MSDWESVKARLEDLLNVLETGHAVIEVGNAPDIRAAIQRVSELEARLDASFDAMVKRDAEYAELKDELAEQSARYAQRIMDLEAEVERHAWRLLKNVEDHLSEQLLRKEHGELRADFDRLCKERDELLVVVARSRAALRGEGEK